MNFCWVRMMVSLGCFCSLNSKVVSNVMVLSNQTLLLENMSQSIMFILFLDQETMLDDVVASS